MDISKSKFTEEAFYRLRETLGFSEDMDDLFTVLSVANIRIKRLKETLDNKNNISEESI